MIVSDNIKGFFMKEVFGIITICVGVIFPIINSPAAQQRYISLAPSTTEILFALGLDEEIVGVSSYCDYPPEASEKEKVGDFSRPNTEKIISLKPDYIFCTGLEQAPAVQQLKRLGLRVYVADPSTIRQLLQSIREIGEITYRQKESTELTRRLQDEIDTISKITAEIEFTNKPKVFIEIWSAPLTTAGKGSFVDELITLAGGVNAAGATKRPYSFISPEEIISRDPEIIILAYMTNGNNAVTSVSERPGWSRISAVRHNRVYDTINPDLLLRPGPRIIEGLKQLFSIIHPE